MTKAKGRNPRIYWLAIVALAALVVHEATAQSPFYDQVLTLGGTVDEDMTFPDNIKLKFGTGDDAEMYYDGTNLQLDPDAVGAGKLVLGGDISLNNAHKLVTDAAGNNYINDGAGNTMQHVVAGGLVMTATSGELTMGTSVHISHTTNGYLYNTNSVTKIGGACTTSHSLGVNDVCVGTGDLEVDGWIYADGGLRSVNTITLDETTTPTPIANSAQIYSKNDNLLYYQDGAGTEHAIGGQEKDVTYSYSSGSLGTHFVGGYYDAPAADANLNEGSTTVTHGSAAAGARGAHAFLVAGGAGSVDAGTVSIVVSGTSYNEDTGTRTTSDTETLVADITTMSLNAYYETTKLWLGQITYTLTPAGATTYSADFNYGFAIADENQGINHEVRSFHCQLDGGATDTGLNIELLHHRKTTGWTYHATAFVPGNGALAACATDYSTDCKIIADTYFSYSRHNLSTTIDAVNGEGIVIRVTTGANNSIAHMVCHVGVVE